MREHFPPDSQNVKNLDELNELSGNHSETLYDQNEDAAGEKSDLATGRPFDNTRSEAADERFSVVRPGEVDALPDLPEEEDEASRWLRENGGL